MCNISNKVFNRHADMTGDKCNLSAVIKCPFFDVLMLGPPIPTTYSNTSISVFQKINTGIPVLIPVLMNEI